MTPDYQKNRAEIQRILAGLEWWQVMEVARDVIKMLDHKAKTIERKIEFDKIMRGLEP